MKASNWIIGGLVILCCVFLFWDIQDRDYAESQRIEKEQAEADFKHTLDSAYSAGKLLIDSITYYKADKKRSDSTVNAIKVTAGIIQKRYEKVAHISYSNDTLRSSALSDLYPSLRNR